MVTSGHKCITNSVAVPLPQQVNEEQLQETDGIPNSMLLFSLIYLMIQ